jgi:predicted NBD/HSP70 family sugar kinase
MAKKPARKARARAPRKARRILAVDIGGTKIKVMVSGESEPLKADSGSELTPTDMVERVKRLARGHRYDVVSIGYPGLVGAKGPLAEPGNLGSGWVGFNFAAAFDCPVRIMNDAAMQALGSYDGGRMLFLGLGTGLGSVLIAHCTIVGLELGELRYEDGKTYSERFGREGLEKEGKKAWRKQLLEAVPALQRAFRADYVVLGGGNSKFVKEPLPPGVRVGNNLTAFTGAFRLWEMNELQTLDAHNGGSMKSKVPTDWRLL